MLTGLPDHARRQLQDQREIGKDLPVQQARAKPIAELATDVPGMGVDQSAEADRRLDDKVGSNG